MENGLKMEEIEAFQVKNVTFVVKNVTSLSKNVTLI